MGSLGLAGCPVWAKYSLGHLQRRGGGWREVPFFPPLAKVPSSGRAPWSREGDSSAQKAGERQRVLGTVETSPAWRPIAAWDEPGGSGQRWSGTRGAGSNGSGPLPPELPEVRQSQCVTAPSCVTVTHSVCVFVYTPTLEWLPPGPSPGASVLWVLLQVPSPPSFCPLPYSETFSPGIET